MAFKKKKGINLAYIIVIFIVFLFLLFGLDWLNPSSEELVIKNIAEERVDNEITVHNPNDTSVEVEKKTEIQDKYYYNQLEEGSKVMYDTLLAKKDVLESGSGKIFFPDNENIHDNSFQSCWDAFKLDHPEIFYVDTTKISFITQKTTYVFFTRYSYSIEQKDNTYYIDTFNNREELELANVGINSVTSSILNGCTGSRVNQIKYVHDWIIDHVSYVDDGKKENDTIYGTLVKKKAVCEGYATAFKYIMDKLDIPCVIVFGNATNSDGKTEAHAWNYVQMEDGNWYAIDCTWDDPILYGNGRISTEVKYRYFLKGSNTLFTNHVEDNDVSGTGQDFKYPKIEEEDY
jgi:hypothetical protein